MNQKRHHDDAAHVQWVFRREAFRWTDSEIQGINFIPFARATHEWLQQRGNGLPAASLQDKDGIDKYTNPFTYSVSSIVLGFAHAVNAACEFGESLSEISPLEAEVERIRIADELIL